MVATISLNTNVTDRREMTQVSPTREQTVLATEEVTPCVSLGAVNKSEHHETTRVVAHPSRLSWWTP